MDEERKSLIPQWAELALIVGKGPTAREVSHLDKRTVCALNGAAKLCGRVDFLFVNDVSAIDELDETTMGRVANLVLPTELHITTDGRKTQPWGDCPEWFLMGPEIFLHVLRTAKTPRRDVPCFGGQLSVAETAVAFLIHHGQKYFQTIGVDPDSPTYHSTFRGGRQATWKNPRWYRQNWRRCQSRVSDAGGIIERVQR